MLFLLCVFRLFSLSAWRYILCILFYYVYVAHILCEGRRQLEKRIGVFVLAIFGQGHCPCPFDYAKVYLSLSLFPNYSERSFVDPFNLFSPRLRLKCPFVFVSHDVPELLSWSCDQSRWLPPWQTMLGRLLTFGMFFFHSGLVIF